MTKAEKYEKAMYRFFRHIQDQIENVPGWMQHDAYTPEIDAYEFDKFVAALGPKNNAARWNELHEKYFDQTQQETE